MRGCSGRRHPRLGAPLDSWCGHAQPGSSSRRPPVRPRGARSAGGWWGSLRGAPSSRRPAGRVGGSLCVYRPSRAEKRREMSKRCKFCAFLRTKLHKISLLLSSSGRSSAPAYAAGSAPPSCLLVGGSGHTPSRRGRRPAGACGRRVRTCGSPPAPRGGAARSLSPGGQGV